MGFPCNPLPNTVKIRSSSLTWATNGAFLCARNKGDRIRYVAKPEENGMLASDSPHFSRSFVSGTTGSSS